MLLGFDEVPVTESGVAGTTKFGTGQVLTPEADPDHARTLLGRGVVELHPWVIDEIQRRPDLLPLLRVLADRPGTPARNWI